MKPYSYLLGWPNQDRWYYGIRYAKGCDPSDLWTTYKTSSQHVHDFVLEFGDPSIILVRKTFKSVDSAREWEHKVLRRLKVIKKDKWINRTDNKAIAPLYGDDNPAKRPEVRALISKNTCRKWGDDNPMKKPEVASKVSKKLKGRKNHWQVGDKNPAKRPEIRQKLSRPGSDNPFYNHTHTDSFKENMSKRFKNIPKEKVTCPFCNKTGGKNTMGRWHFNNCKSILLSPDHLTY